MPTQNLSSKIFERLDQLNEFERAPISSDKLQPGRYFAAMFTGEHIAATEFVIGALFVSFGAGASDVLVGLLLGNLMAVLSWALLCAPIAVQTRLTLYWYLRRIVGPGLTVACKIRNGVLYCILDGAMIAGSASAVSLGINTAAEALGFDLRIAHPQLTDTMPNSVGWVVVVVLVGGGGVPLGLMGFKRLGPVAA